MQSSITCYLYNTLYVCSFLHINGHRYKEAKIQCVYASQYEHTQKNFQFDKNWKFCATLERIGRIKGVSTANGLIIREREEKKTEAEYNDTRIESEWQNKNRSETLLYSSRQFYASAKLAFAFTVSMLFIEVCNTLLFYIRFCRCCSLMHVPRYKVIHLKWNSFSLNSMP